MAASTANRLPARWPHPNNFLCTVLKTLKDSIPHLSPLGRLRWWPRSLRWQMLVSLVLLEVLSIGLFAIFLTHMEDRDMHDRDRQRLQHQVTSLSVQAEEAYEDNRPDFLAVAVRLVGAAPSVLRAKITDPAGNMLSVSAGEPGQVHLIPSERSILDRFTGHAPRIFSLGDDRWEAVKPIYFAYQLRGYAWVESDPVWEEEQVFDTVRATLIFGIHLDRRFIRPGLAHVVGHHPPHGDPASRHSRPRRPSGIERRLSPSRHRRKRVRRSHLRLQQHGRLH